MLPFALVACEEQIARLTLCPNAVAASTLHIDLQAIVSLAPKTTSASLRRLLVDSR